MRCVKEFWNILTLLAARITRGTGWARSGTCRGMRQMDMLGSVLAWVLAGVGIFGGIVLAVRGVKKHSRERAEVPLP